MTDETKEDKVISLIDFEKARAEQQEEKEEAETMAFEECYEIAKKNNFTSGLIIGYNEDTGEVGFTSNLNHPAKVIYLLELAKQSVL